MKAVTALPELTLSVNGDALDRSRAMALAELSVRQRLSMPAQCELVFEAPPGPLPDLTTMPVGAALTLAVAGARDLLFSGEITAVEQRFGGDASRQLRVRAYDVSHRLRQRRRIRSHVKVSALSLAQELAGDLGLDVEGGAGGPTWELLVQDRQSDLELLVETLERSALYYTVRGGTLHLLTLAGAGDEVELELGDTLLEASLEVNAGGATRSVSVSGWNALTAEAHAGEAGDAHTAAPILEDAAPSRFGADGRLYLPNEGVADDAQAAGLAAAELDRRQGEELVLDGLAEGSSGLRPGTVVTLRGVGAGPSRFALTAVDHAVDARSGFVSKISSRAPGPCARPRTASVTVGTVTRVDDPDRKGRVRVSLPSYGDVETGWMEVVALAAGAGKGIVALPDVKDTVVVLMPFQDPASGIVLGGLYGPGGAPLAGGVEEAAVRVLALVSAGGMKLTLDDGQRHLRLEDALGSFLELAPERVTLHSAPDLDISAPGRRIRIRAAAIDFETA